MRTVSISVRTECIESKTIRATLQIVTNAEEIFGNDVNREDMPDDDTFVGAASHRR